jgi:Zn-dependent protease
MGPAMNLLLALIATILLFTLGLSLSRLFPESHSLNFFIPWNNTSLAGIPAAKFFIYLNIFLLNTALINIILSIFNLMPIPPLDGSWLIPKILPPGLRDKYEKLRPYSFILLIIIIVTNAFNFIIDIPITAYFAFLNYIVGPVLGLS